jgi:malonyl CoA-acyl carrier protein transacylase
MAAVLGLTHQRAQEIADGYGLALANDNSPGQVVLTGDSDALARAAQAIRTERGRSILLGVEGAFHSPAMEPAVDDLRRALESTEIRSPATPVISNVSTRPYRAPGEIRRLLLAQLTGPVRFRECVLHLAEAGVTEFEDLGPGDVVGKLARSTAPRGLDTVDA